MSVSLIQLKIAQLTRPDEWDSEDDGIFEKKTSDSDGESQRLAHLDADSEGDRKSSKQSGTVVTVGIRLDSTVL